MYIINGSLRSKTSLFLFLVLLFTINYNGVDCNAQNLVFRRQLYTVSIQHLNTILFGLLSFRFILFHFLSLIIGQQVINRLSVIDGRFWDSQSDRWLNSGYLRNYILQYLELMRSLYLDVDQMIQLLFQTVNYLCL